MTPDETLAFIYRAAEMDRENTKQVAENHLDHVERAVMNIAALKTLSGDALLLELVRAAQSNPT